MYATSHRLNGSHHANQQPSDASIPIKKGMNRLKLIVNECRTNQWIECVLCVHIPLKCGQRRIHILRACPYRFPPIQTEISMPIIYFVFPFFNRNGNTAPMERCISASSRSFCVKRALSICYRKRNERYLKVSILLSHSPMINTSARLSYRGVFAFYIRFIVSLPEDYCLRSPSHVASTCAA